MVADHLIFTELIHQGPRSKIYRAQLGEDKNARPVIVKQPRNDNEASYNRLKHEHQMLQPGLPCTLQPIELLQSGNSGQLLFPDNNLISLHNWLKQYTPNLKLRVNAAINMVSALGQVHQAQIIHKQITPDNVLIDPTTHTVTLIDFSLSTRLSREHPSSQTALTSHENLLYIAPEQSGRINRYIDYRTDYYALGVTLYQLFTGTPPFQTEDNLELVHCHIARQPVEPYIQNTDLPESLSQIIMKLLSKDASQRYQSSFGISYDLKHCLDHEMGEFQLASKDLSERFELPQTLYGRGETIKSLKNSFDQVCLGNQSLVLISGYAGVGKSSLVHELREYISQHHGFFAVGKFDQYQRNRPYTAIYQVLQTLIRHLLTESDEKIEQWRKRLQLAIGDNAQVLFKLIPELELITGEQPVAPKLSPSEEQHRFSHIMRQMLKVFATQEHPLVLFFDDLHWADLSSLKLLEKLCHNPQHPHLLLIGSYRQHDLSPGHPFRIALKQLHTSPLEIRSHDIHPLLLPDVQLLIADTLGRSELECKPLADICYEKTQGNPFFLVQFLQDLYEKRLIYLRENCWQWDEQAIKNCEITDNVIEFMLDKIQRLSNETQTVLKIAACIGNPVPLQLLARVCDKPIDEIDNSLWQALAEGLLLPLDSENQFEHQLPGQRVYRFIHDRVQQAAYSLIEQDQLEPLHLRIGETLHQQLSEHANSRRIFDVTNHLNQARSLITQEDEQINLARLNLKAGIRARESTAFESAFDYFSTGLELIREHTAAAPELLSELHRYAAETAYINADFIQMNLLIDSALQQIQDFSEQLQLKELRIQALVAQNNFHDALSVALELLGNLNIHLPENPSSLTINASLVKSVLLLSYYSDERILQLPPMRKSEILSAMSLLANMFGVVKFSSNSGLRPLVMAKEVELTLHHGLSDESAIAFAGYGGVLCGKYQMIDLGYRLGSLSMKLCRNNPQLSDHKPQYLYNAYIRHYREPLQQCSQDLYESHIRALEQGDIEWSAYSLAAHIQYDFPLNKELNSFAEQIKQYTLQLIESGQKQSLHYTLMTLQAVEVIRSGDFTILLDGEYYAEEEMLQEYQDNNHKTAICLHYYYKGLLAFLFTQHEKADRCFKQALEYSPYISGTYTGPYLSFIDALNTILLLQQQSVLERPHKIKQVKKYLKSVKRLTKSCPENHLHHQRLIHALLCAEEGKYNQAIDLFDGAIRHTEEQSFPLDNALCLEITARFYKQWGKAGLAQHYLQQAHAAYSQWGAISKCNQLEQKYSFLRGSEPLADKISNEQITSHTEEELSNSQYDIAAVIHASQAISDEIMLEPLLARLIKLALINAGAQRAVLLLKQQTLVLAAEAQIEGEATFYNELPLNMASEILPTSIIHYVARTKENVVLGNARRHEMFQQDHYIKQSQPLSLLALPILYHNELTAILYLENNQSRDVFDRNRLEALQILSAQAAISIENAKLYQSLEQSENDYKSLFINAVEGIFRATPEGKFISANPALASLLNYDTPEHFLTEITDIGRQCYVDEEDRFRFLEKLKNEERVVNYETRWLKRGGEPVSVSLSARIVTEPGSNAISYEGSVTDISERKAKEAAEKARSEAVAENEAKSLFLATMSHEIRTPMNGILGMAQLMKRSDLNPTQTEQVETIYNAGQSLLTILNNILDYSKVESGQIELEHKPFRIEQVMDEIYNLFLPLAQEKGLQIVPKTDRNLPAVCGDQRVLAQVLMNICSNALKFTQQGFINLKATGRSQNQKQITLRVEVEDSGIGIAESSKNRIFQHFSQADSSITRRYGGTGLGLAISKQLVELQGGNIGFDSQEGVGTTFWLEIPYPLSGEQIALPEPETLSVKQQPLDILLVEDTPINQQVTQGLLESDGHQVTIADDGYTALSLHNDHLYDLILMDIHLPDMDGMETTRQMRKHSDPEKASVKIIALTASVTPQEVKQYTASGMDGVLAKPIEYQALQAILNRTETHSKTNQVADTLLDEALLLQHNRMLGQESLNELLQQYRIQAEDLLLQIEQNLSDKQFEQAAKAAHMLSGAAANFGFQNLQNQCKQLEEELNNSVSPLISSQQLNETYQQSCQRLDSLQWT